MARSPSRISPLHRWNDSASSARATSERGCGEIGLGSALLENSVVVRDLTIPLGVEDLRPLPAGDQRGCGRPHRGTVNFARIDWTMSRKWQPTRWSLTTPSDCIAA